MLSFSRDPHRQDPVHSKHSFEWENYWWQSCKMKFKRSKPPMARKLFCAGKSNDFPNQEVTRTWSVKWYDCFVSVMVLLSPCSDLNFRWHELSPANSSLCSHVQVMKCLCGSAVPWALGVYVSGLQAPWGKPISFPPLPSDCVQILIHVYCVN